MKGELVQFGVSVLGKSLNLFSFFGARGVGDTGMSFRISKSCVDTFSSVKKEGWFILKGEDWVQWYFWGQGGHWNVSDGTMYMESMVLMMIYVSICGMHDTTTVVIWKCDVLDVCRILHTFRFRRGGIWLIS